MDDPKTKIKIKTLELLVLITIKTKMIDKIKSILIAQMNQVYYEMFVEKLGKEMKALRGTPEMSEANSSGTSHHRRDGKTISFPTLRKNKSKHLSIQLRRITRRPPHSRSTVGQPRRSRSQELIQLGEVLVGRKTTEEASDKKLNQWTIFLEGTSLRTFPKQTPSLVILPPAKE